MVPPLRSRDLNSPEPSRCGLQRLSSSVTAWLHRWWACAASSGRTSAEDQERETVISMHILVRTELLKLATIRGPWILTFVALALTTLLGVQPVLKAGRTGPSIGTVGAELAVLDAMGRGAVVTLVIGVLIMTSEFRHQTVTASLLSSPRRPELINAKAVTATLVGLLFGAATMIIVVAIGTLSGAMQPNLINGDVALRGVGLLLTYPLYALIGVGTGALLARNQPLADLAGPVVAVARGVQYVRSRAQVFALVHWGNRRSAAKCRQPPPGSPHLVGRRSSPGVRPDLSDQRSGPSVAR